VGKDYLRVKPAELAEAASHLDHMVEELEHAGDLVDASRDAVGSAAISDALHHFATNWSQKRERICKTVEECSHVLKQGHTAYTRADGELGSKAAHLVHE
jgi:uncharacterized protein YukE